MDMAGRGLCDNDDLFKVSHKSKLSSSSFLFGLDSEISTVSEPSKRRMQIDVQIDNQKSILFAYQIVHKVLTKKKPEISPKRTSHVFFIYSFMGYYCFGLK